MSARPLLRLCLGLLLTAAPAVAQAQVAVKPPSHVLVLAPGESGKITLKSSCSATFTPKASMNTEDMLSFDAGSAKAGKARTIKITATGEVGDSGTVRVDVAPVDEQCGGLQLIFVSVYIAQPGKDVERAFKAGDKKAQPPIPGAAGRIKQLRADLKLITAGHQAVIKTILSELKAGAVTVPPVVPPGPGEEAPPAPPGMALDMTQSERAFVALALSESVALDRAEQAWWAAMEGMAKDAIKLLVLAGYVDTAPFTVPHSLHPNGGGEWDRQVASAQKNMAASLRALALQSNKADGGIVSLSHKRGEPLFLRSRGLRFPVLDHGGASPVTGQMANPLTNMGISLLSARAWNGPTGKGLDTSNGRVLVIARLPGDGAWFSVQQLDFFGVPKGSSSGAAVSLNPLNHQLVGMWPESGEASSLPPGTWRTTIAGPNNSVGRIDLVVPAR